MWFGHHVYLSTCPLRKEWEEFLNTKLLLEPVEQPADENVKAEKPFRSIWDRSCRPQTSSHCWCLCQSYTEAQSGRVYFKISAFPGPRWLKTKCINCGKKCSCFHLCWSCLCVFISFKNTACTSRPRRRKESLPGANPLLSISFIRVPESISQVSPVHQFFLGRWKQPRTKNVKLLAVKYQCCVAVTLTLNGDAQRSGEKPGVGSSLVAGQLVFLQIWN